MHVLLTGKLEGLRLHTPKRHRGTYEWAPSERPTFFPGRQADILTDGQPVGCFGIVHPDVLKHFDIPAPVAVLELDLEPFCYDQDNQALHTHLQMAL